MNTVIFGGSFNPIHNGHLEMLTAAAEYDFVDRVLILPDAIPPHKKTGDDFASKTDRLKMCEILAQENKKAEVSDIEIKRGGKSYMYDTVCELERLYPEDKLYLLVGGDMAVSLNSWHRAEELLEKVSIIAVGRNTVGEAELKTYLSELKEKGIEVILCDKKTTSVSSTEIRKKLKQGETDIPIPQKIKEYIQENQIYKKEM